ncbi:hypothetical protein JOF53_001378 [Crossiella equi]|uniref:Septum formation-related domain-containing protein n=1 Tax=Crossiella equi TaxID=130796 RepID=A0ABS5A869_9PSEU|nr:septum formation family protein [Crossiella equi]MBP2472506.1 hypothetical protein [Crossiella equi]
MRLTPCTEPHNAQVVGSYRAENREQPADMEAVTPKAKERCPAIVAVSTDVAALSETDELLFLGQDGTSWERGHRDVHCIVLNDTGTWHRSLLR